MDWLRLEAWRQIPWNGGPLTRVPLRLGSALIALFLTGIWTGTVLGHQPHDVVHNVAISPRFVEDHTVFATLTTPAHSGILRSTDGGWTWSQLVRGLDNRGHFTSLFIAPRFPDDPMLMASSDEDGVYRSDNGGETWYQVNDGLPTLKIKSVDGAYLPSGQLVMLAVGVEGGVFRSVNRGESWERVIPASYEVNTVEFSPRFFEDGLVLAGLPNGRLIYSRDRGWTWSLIPTFRGASSVTSLGLEMSDPDRPVLFVSTSRHGMFRSLDRGRSFQSINDGLTDLRVTDLALSPGFESDRTLWAISAEAATFRSDDGGESWTLYSLGVRLSDQTPVHFHDLEVSRTFGEDQTLFLGSFEGLYRSDTAGRMWMEHEVRSARLISGFGLAPTYPDDPLLIVSRYGGGLYVSEDAGMSWTVRNQGISNAFIYTTESSPTFDQDGILFAVQAGALARSGNRGQHWSLNRVNQDIVEYPTALRPSPGFVNDRTVFIGTRHAGVYRSVDGGQHFTHVLDLEGFVPSVALSPDFGRDRIAVTFVRGHGVFISEDGGDEWINRNEGLPPSDRTMVAAAMKPDGTLIILAGTRQGLFSSTDLGLNWNAITTHEDLVDANISSIWPAPDYQESQDLVVVLQGEGALRSTDGGRSWTVFGEQFIESNDEIREVRYSPQHVQDHHLFVSTSMDVHLSRDHGDSWETIPITAMRYEESSQAIYYHGNWSIRPEDRASARHIAADCVVGGRATFLFTGTGVRWVGARGPALGIASLRLDGVDLDPVDCYSDQFEIDGSLLDLNDLAPGPHQLDIWVSGEKNEHSSDYWVVIDAFDLLP